MKDPNIFLLCSPYALRSSDQQNREFPNFHKSLNGTNLGGTFCYPYISTMSTKKLPGRSGNQFICPNDVTIYALTEAILTNTKTH